jgi:serine/threonine protein kinase
MMAEHLELGKLVAFKEPRADRFGSDAEIEAYLQEARVLASLDHPHIVPVYDAGRTAEGSCYVVSKYIDGMDLAAYLKQHPLTFAQTAELLACVADALQQTHNRGLVHRDIKPANILIDSHGQPYVADFGLAMRDGPVRGHDEGPRLDSQIVGGGWWSLRCGRELPGEESWGPCAGPTSFAQRCRSIGTARVVACHGLRNQRP